ncbi:MAG TPA: DUF2809 domain-containing protein [Chitinophagaceae bacterium]|nr:DUF2809 domain-containing protein [Chitinophagaceae bacterium]
MQITKSFSTKHFLLRRMLYALLFIFFIWLALATRKHPEWFHPLVVKYGGDTIWSGDFLLLLRIIFPKTSLYKLAVCNYVLGVLDELSQLWNTPLLNEIRATKIGKLMLGVGFVWSDLICYAAGTLLAWLLIVAIEKYLLTNRS